MIDEAQLYLNLSIKSSAIASSNSFNSFCYGSSNTLNNHSRTSLNSTTDSTSPYCNQSIYTINTSNSVNKITEASENSFYAIAGSSLANYNKPEFSPSTNSFSDECKECSNNLILTPSKITIEPINNSSIDIPELFTSPSRIQWNFLSGLNQRDILCTTESTASTPTSYRYDDDKTLSYNHQPIKQSSNDVKTVSIWRTENDESNAIIFHHESEIVENCCNNYFQCDDDMFIDTQQCTSELCDYFEKTEHLPEILNNSLDFSSFSSSASTSIKINHRNDISPDMKFYEKRTNLEQQQQQQQQSSSSSSSNILTVLNKSTNTSVNNLYKNFNQNLEVNLSNDDKSLTTTTSSSSSTSTNRNNNQNYFLPTQSNYLEPYSISSSDSDKPLYLTRQNQFVANSRRRQSTHLLSNSQVNDNNPVTIQRWRSLTHTVGLGDLMRLVRNSTRKCAEYLRGENDRN